MMQPQLRYPITIVTVSAAVFVVYGLVVGVYTLLSIPPNPCEMTYMFETPKYIPVPVEEGSSKYKLYVYGEGRYAQSLVQGHVHGLPVLFIPGNAGCYKQVRSLASVSYRMHEDLRKLHHFNYFTIDYNEEFSGLYGGVLFTQADFAVAAIRAIQRLYTSPTKVILIGHSMGGLVARSVFVHPQFEYSSVDVVITLSTPHSTPPFNFDWNIHSFYSEWEGYVLSHPQVYQDKVFVSIGSGIRDTMVQPYQTVIQESKHNSINVQATCIPDVHVSPDHIQMVWCRQLVKKMCLTLFDMIDRDTLKITEDVDLIRDVVRVNLLGHQSVIPDKSPMRKARSSVTVKEMLYHASVVGRDGWKEFVIPVKDGYSTTIVARNPPRERWLYYCVSQDDCENISNQPNNFPDNYIVHSDRRSGGKFLVYVNALHGREKNGVRSQLIVQHHTAGALEISSHEGGGNMRISERVEQVLTVSTMTPGDYWLSMKVSIKQTSCSHLKSTLRLLMGRLVSGTEDTYTQGTEEGLDVLVELLTINPRTSSMVAPQVQLILDPACTYSVEAQTEGFRTSANLIRYHYPLLGGVVLFVLLGLCRNILHGLDPSLLQSLTQEQGTMYTFLFIVLVKILLWALPALHGFLGIDWMTVQPEILLTALLTVHTLAYVCCGVCTLLSKVCGRILTMLRLTESRAVYFTWRFQTVLFLAGLVTSGSWVNLLNLLLLLFYVCSRKTASPAAKVLLLLHLYGTLLQLPALLSWLKNLSVHFYWLEQDLVSRVAMAISNTTCCLLTTFPAQPHHNVNKLSRGLDLLRLLTLTMAITRGHLVVPALYTSLLGLGAGFILASPKTKVS